MAFCYWRYQCLKSAWLHLYLFGAGSESILISVCFEDAFSWISILLIWLLPWLTILFYMDVFRIGNPLLAAPFLLCRVQSTLSLSIGFTEDWKLVDLPGFSLCVQRASPTMFGIFGYMYILFSLPPFIILGGHSWKQDWQQLFRCQQADSLDIGLTCCVKHPIYSPS